MRIISGKLKGKKISFINSSITRPLRDYVKENIFNIILHEKNNKLKLDNANILDLYSGTGSFGIECLSRNANKVVFIEKDPTAFSILRKNVTSLKILENTELVFKNIEDHIYILNESNKFDIIFLDPPYKDTSFIKVISIIKERKIYNNNHKIIIHRERKCEDELTKIINIDLLKNYGRSKIIFGSF